MDTAPASTDSKTQQRLDRRRIVRAFNASALLVLLLMAVYASQAVFNVHAWSVLPRDWHGLWGILTAPLLHGSLQHLAGNATALLILGTLAGSVYPKATARALPLLWLGPGVAAWLLGDPGSAHLGASGVTHGLMFLVFVLGLLRRDRAAIAAGMVAFLFYGGMLVTILPHEAGISWQSHLGGAIAGVIMAIVLRHRDPLPPKPHYSWEDEEDEDGWDEHDELEPPSPQQVPVRWVYRSPRPVNRDMQGRVPDNVVPFRRRPDE